MVWRNANSKLTMISSPVPFGKHGKDEVYVCRCIDCTHKQNEKTTITYSSVGYVSDTTYLISQFGSQTCAKLIFGPLSYH